MAVVQIKLGPGRLAPYGKKMVAHSMFHKGTHFVAASMLLKQRGGFHDVVLHLLAQGREVIQKGLLLAHDYDKYRPSASKAYRARFDSRRGCVADSLQVEACEERGEVRPTGIE